MNGRLCIMFFSGLLTLMAACGGGGLGILAEGGIGGTGKSLGTISGFGSVIVNGTELTVDNNTMITADGNEVTQSELNVGFVVRIEADFGSNTAKRIDYTDTVSGQINGQPTINPDTLVGTFTVLGQTVRTNGLTSFSNIADVSALLDGDFVDISGIRDTDGTLVASFIDKKATPLTEFRVVGRIQNLDTTNNRFNVVALTVDFSGINLPEGVTENTVVQIKGTSFNASTVTLVADSVAQSVLDLSAAVGDEIELEGFVNQFVNLSDFTVNNQPVNAGNAIIENGVIGLNIRVEVEGSIGNNGVLQADKVEIKQDDNFVRIEAPSDAVNTSAGTVILLGVPVQVTAQTRLEDKSDAKQSPFGLANINPGDRIEMRGFLSGTKVVASRLEREDPDDDVVLQGPVDQGGVDSVNETVTVLGITLRTDNDTELEDKNDSPINPSTFFSSVTEGSLVKGKWTPFVSTNDPVDELELEEN